MKTTAAIVPLADATLESCGGKAANLARLMSIGAPVPAGFVIPNDTLEYDAVELDELTTLLPEAVIVRSSAIGEDSADASFAGQLDSISGVTTPAAMREAIDRVWRSRFSDRVLAYQAAMNKPLAGMGVIVQRQIDAAVSGVLFTESPTDPDCLLLEFCAGLGEALVSGAVNPGRITIARSGGAWKQIAEPDHLVESRLLLDDSRIESLARLALEVEQTFGAPQDIEWTIDSSGKLWLVQSRPITQPVPRTHGPRNSETQFWSNANVNENFPQPISPLLYSIARVGYYYYFRNLGKAFGISEKRLASMEPALRQIIGVHGARMYYNLTSIHSVLRSAPFGDLLAGSFNQFVGAETTTARAVGAGYRLRQGLELAVIAAKTTWQYLFLTHRVEEFERTVDAYAAATHPRRLQRKTSSELLTDFRGFVEIRCHRWKNASLADAGSMVCYGALQRLLARAFPGRDQQALHNTLLKALPDLVSSVPPVKLWELSRLIRRDRRLLQLVLESPAEEVLAVVTADERFTEFRTAFDSFLEHWGFRCSSELMLTVPSFQEEPAPLIEILKAYTAMDGDSPAHLLKLQEEERLRETAAALSALNLPRRIVIGTVLRWTQKSIQLRERARLKQALLYSRLRRVALAIGERLVARGRFTTADDVFCLTAEELDLLVAGGSMFPEHVKPLVALRRQAHSELSALTPPDSMELPSGEYLTSRAVSCAGSDRGPGSDLTGVGACGGETTARAAILFDVTEAHKLVAGDVLVTRQTDPGWGPIFPLISGLVIERGGMLSHGAIIAREFGIPSVVGVKDATRLIPHGMRVTVDGNHGVVRLAGAA